MRELGRTWAALAALGAGLVHLGAAARAPLLPLVLLSVLGAVETGWAVATLARRRAVIATPALVAALAVIVVTGVLVLTRTGAPMSTAALVGAAALDLAVAVLLAGRRRVRTGRRPPVAGYLVGLVAGAAVVAAVTTTSLASGLPAGNGMTGMGM